ncbi:MAG: hypothetical protein M1819_000987 [Sarea resinae]|nr:MAG: hypothetical protein M1819_000987 [Sarea resinae]
MTEPEDLDEDLFADLYDGDDSIPKPTAAQPETTEPEATPSGLTQNQAEAPNEESQLEAPTEDQISGAHEDQQMYGNGSNEQAEATWDGGNTNDFGEGSGDQNAHGPGIKEDG